MKEAAINQEDWNMNHLGTAAEKAINEKFPGNVRGNEGVVQARPGVALGDTMLLGPRCCRVGPLW